MKRIGVFLKINIKLQIKIMNNSISFDAVNHRFTTSYFLSEINVGYLVVEFKGTNAVQFD